MDERTIIESHAGADRIALIADSHLRLTGRALVPDGADVADAMWNHDAVVLAHGTEDDPIFFYANRAALDLFEMTASTFIRLPSRHSAEALRREERARLLERVTADGFIDDYSGIRISSTGKRFRIERATVWNLVDAASVRHGQAAWFDHWVPVGD